MSCMIMYKKYIKLVLKIAISSIFLFWVVFKVDWASVINSIKSVSIFYLAIYVMIVLLGMVISSYKWQILADFKEIKLKFSNFFKFYLAGTFINNFMPSFIGGDTFKAYKIGKPQGRYIEAASSVAMDRITGLVGATVLALLFSLLNIKKIADSPILLIVNLIIFLSLLLDIFIAWIRKKSFWFRFKKYFPDKFAAFVIDLGTYNNNSNILSRAITWSLFFNLIGVALSNYILFMAFGINISLINYLSVIFLVSIVSSIPISINNIGIKEWAYITFFGVFGLSASPVVAVAIVSRFIQMLISFFALPVYLRREKK